MDWIPADPASSFELSRWEPYEVKGVVKLMGWVILIYLALFAVVRIGA